MLAKFILALLVLTFSGYSRAAPDPCIGGRQTTLGAKTTVLFVNGIYNNLLKACGSSAALAEVIDGGGVKYNVSYIWNPNAWQDLLELMVQEQISAKAAHDVLKANNGIFDKQAYYKKLGEQYQILTQSPNETRQEILFVRDLHNEIERLLALDQSVVVVAHSQANHMIEAAYSMMVFLASSDPVNHAWKLKKIRVVGAASVAHSTPNDNYISIAEDGALASFESEIFAGGLALYAIWAHGEPLERNYAVCSGPLDIDCFKRIFQADITGHGFVEIYLSDSLNDSVLGSSLRSILVGKIKASLQALQSSTNTVVSGPNNHSYEIITCGTWTQCRDAAIAKGGSLVTVRSQAENDWLASQFPMSKNYWIGATNDGVPGAWRWLSGESFSFKNWGANLNNSGGNENCAHFYDVTPGVWNDLRCDSPDVTMAIVEYGGSGSVSFVDDFSGTSLDSTKWVVTSLGGDPTTLTMSSGYLNISVPGGSCGVCGTSDGVTLKPQVDPLLGDFAMELSAEELARASRDSTRPLNTIQFLLSGASADVGIYVVGDVSSNQGNPGHIIYGYYRDGANTSYPIAKSLTVGQYYALKFRIRRSGGVLYLGYKLQQDADWTEARMPDAFPSAGVQTPRIVVASGDGGSTSANSSFSARLDYFTISRSASTVVEVAASAFVAASSVNIAANIEAGNTCRNTLVYNAPPYTAVSNIGEWIISAPAAGSYAMAVDYAAADPRPVNVKVNGALALSNVLGDTGNGWCVSDVITRTAGTVQLNAGQNLVRIEGTTIFPHLLRLRFTK